MRIYGSIGDARQAFEPFARLEPRLWKLWERCEHAAPPPRRVDPLDDAYDEDPFEVDVVAADKAGAGWCAEDYFLHEVKSELLLLVGAHRTRGPHELQTSEAYETVYDILLGGVLACSCACCAEDHDEARPHSGDEGRPGPG